MANQGSDRQEGDWWGNMDSYASESFRGQSAHFYSILTQNPLKLKSMWPFHNCSKEGCDWFTYVNDTLTAHLSSTLSSRGTPDSTSGLSMLRPDMRVIGQNQGSSGVGGQRPGGTRFDLSWETESPLAPLAGQHVPTAHIDLCHWLWFSISVGWLRWNLHTLLLFI